jgi:hypothetical protein
MRHRVVLDQVIVGRQDRCDAALYRKREDWDSDPPKFTLLDAHDGGAGRTGTQLTLGELRLKGIEQELRVYLPGASSKKNDALSESDFVAIAKYRNFPEWGFSGY